MSHSARDAQPRRSLWIPWIFVGGMLLVVVVNGGLVYAALSTFTGVTVGRSFDRGRTYNRVLETAARQDALGWEAEVRWEHGVLLVAAVDRDGRRVAGAWEGTLVRPLEGSELPLTFRAAGNATYVADARPALSGQWEARLRLLGPGGDVLEVRRRIIVS
ncbi:FixH family protein [Falsiroseomonas sp. E2-1-a20]|uniref:FixH family protein n=1 Tax=Falsiroseomonas sp. E2-1-a20 TaxID=3239300 RepID=UPI003F356C35